jgi:cell division protein FtsQ
LVRARRDAVPASVRRFTARARQRRLRAAVPWLAGLAVLAVLAALAAVVYATPLLGVRKVAVAGVDVLDPAEVRAAAAVRRGTPLARVDLDAVGRRVGRLPAVRTATVARVWPSTLLVRVTERVAVAVVAEPAGFGVVDAAGVRFAAVPTRPAGLPLLKLSSPTPTDPTTRAALSVLAALTPQLRERMLVLSAEAPTRIRLELAGGREIIWGDATENDTKARVATSLLNRPGKVIDVSAPNVVTVR